MPNPTLSILWYNKDMGWKLELVEYWCMHYYQLRNYELNPFERKYVFLNDLCISGSQSHLAPYTETCDLNWEFERALKKLGAKETIFRQIYLDDIGEKQPKLFNEFRKILEVENGKD